MLILTAEKDYEQEHRPVNGLVLMDSNWFLKPLFSPPVLSTVFFKAGSIENESPMACIFS